MSEPWIFKPQYTTFRDMQAAHAGAEHTQLLPPAGLYLTRGDGVAVPVTAEMLARAVEHAEKGTTASTLVGIMRHAIAKLLEADHG